MDQSPTIGLFFGSFNPIHVGHLIIANIMVETTGLDKVWFVISPQNPFKHSKGLLHEFDRYDMAKAAVADNYKLDATDIEFHLPKPSYTIHTLLHLSQRHPSTKFRVIMGSDNLESFSRWKSYREILEHYGLYVYPRPGMQLSDLSSHPNVKTIEAPLLNISATFIRECIKKGQSVRYLVPDPVEEMIRIKQFYR